MRRFLAYLSFASFFFGLQAVIKAQDVIVPAGTLLRCTLDEPNFSSKTASVGDPIVCHLSSVSEFGRIVFPRGSYLGGHLADAKEPGHFVGKGHLTLEFDRIGLKSSELPVPSKVIAAQGFKVNRRGEIVGHGHPRRDVVEWLLPPLWPWKVLTLPARGPRPALKGEKQITLRLMDDIEVPRAVAALYSPLHSSVDRIPTPNRPPWAYNRSPASTQPQSFDGSDFASRPTTNISGITYLPPSIPATESQPIVQAGLVNHPSSTTASPDPSRASGHVTFIALKSDTVYGVSSYRIDGSAINYVLADGTTGSVEISAVDWRKTSQLNAEQRTSARP
jgi:hypothetical protein